MNSQSKRHSLEIADESLIPNSLSFRNPPKCGLRTLTPRWCPKITKTLNDRNGKNKLNNFFFRTSCALLEFQGHKFENFVTFVQDSYMVIYFVISKNQFRKFGSFPLEPEFCIESSLAFPLISIEKNLIFVFACFQAAFHCCANLCQVLHSINESK